MEVATTRIRLLRAVDLAATLLFAVEGARAGAEARLDIFGVTVLAFATAFGGGIIRDLLIGDVPPAALRSTSYLLAAAVGGGTVVLLFRSVDEFPSSVSDVLDAGGLSLFCVAGAAKALDYGLHPWSAALLGMITGIGGGMIRDVLLGEVPSVLRVDVYATAALLGATVVVAASALGLARGRAMLIGGVSCFALRMTSVWLDWDLPRAIGS